MKKIITLLLVAIALPLTAQESRFNLGFYASPDISEMIVANGELKETINEMSKIRLAYTAGIAAGFRINSRITFETGIQYSLHGYQTERTEIHMEEPDPLNGYEIRTRMFEGYLGIPLKLRMSHNTANYYFTASAGIVPNYCIASMTKHIFYGDEREVEKMKNTPDRKFTLTPIISAGMGYRLSGSTHLIIEPVFQYDLISMIEDLHIHHWNLGLKMGLMLDLK